MSGLAEFCAKKGFSVSGSDRKQSAATDHLEECGIKIFIGQRASNVDHNPEIVVYSAAISPDNPEYAACVEKNLNMLVRADFLGQLMLLFKNSVSVAGTHGKTSTSSILSLMLIEAGMDPTVALGGTTEFCNSIRNGNTENMVMEACEYKNSFLSFNPAHEIITNIEAEHLDFFKDLDDIRNSFRIFAEKLDTSGFLMVNKNIENHRELFASSKGKLITYALDKTSKPDISEKDCDFFGKLGPVDKRGNYSFDLYRNGSLLGTLELSVPGAHNAENAVGAAGMALLLGADFESVKRACKAFGGAAKRFEYKGTVGGVDIIDDYAHHPTEIRATLEAARNYPHKTLWVAFQPHTYSRTKELFDDFVEALSLADKIILADIYPAREEDPGDIHSSMLVEALKDRKSADAYYFPCFDEIENFLLENIEKDDLLITMGAGDAVIIANSLLGK